MKMPTAVCLLIFWYVFSWIFGFIIWLVDIDDYKDERTGLVWVSKNQIVSWIVTAWLPLQATVYDKLCDTMDGNGLAIVMIGLTLLTLPVSLAHIIIGCLCALIKYAWACFRADHWRKDVTN